MHNSFIIVIILMIIITIYYNTFMSGRFLYMSDKPDDKQLDKPGDKPIYLNLNIKDICQNLNSSKDGISPPMVSDEKNADTKDDKPLADQLADQKKLYNELKLKCEDNSPVYRYTNSDLYLVDNKPNNTGDDVFTSRMIDMGLQAKAATDARSMWSKNSLIPYLEEELEEHADSQWWDDDSLENLF